MEKRMVVFLIHWLSVDSSYLMPCLNNDANLNRQKMQYLSKHVLFLHVNSVLWSGVTQSAKAITEDVSKIVGELNGCN